MKRLVLKFFIYTIALGGLFFLYIKYLAARSIFFPSQVLELTPKDINLSFEDIYLTTADGLTLHGWFIPYDKAKYTLLFYHGNAGNISHRLEKILFLRQTKLNICLIDYRGYGRSKGKPSEKGVYLDAKAAYDYLVNQYNLNPLQIILYGESLGGAIAIDLASKEEIGGLILEGVFSNVRDMGKRIYPFIPRLLLPNPFNSLDKIKKIKVPKLFIHSKNDEIVPLDLGKKLYDIAPEPKQFVPLVGGHNTVFIDSKEEYISTIIKFVEEFK